jgi:hypothetical protein
MTDVSVVKSNGASRWTETVPDIGGGVNAPQTARAALVVEPANQATTAAWADVPDSEIDALHYGSVSYTILNTDGADSLDWQVLASNDDWATAVIVDGPGAVAAGVADSYAVEQAPYRYYIVQIQDTVPASHAAATVVGLAKA